MGDDGRRGPDTTPCDGLWFGRFHLAGPHGPLRADGKVVELARKPLALLWALSSRAGDVVTKDELLATVWPQVVVNEGAIAASLRDVRRALGDDARHPRFVATAHRIGYRFIARVSADRPAHAAPDPAAEAATAIRVARTGAAGGAPFVGRQAELARLRDVYARSLAGQRQLVFVTGEAGLGKSRLVDEFVSSLRTDPQEHGGNDIGSRDDGTRMAHGQCIEHYGMGEPYLPILEAVTRLCRQPGGRVLLPLLRRYAPTWLAQLPGLREDGAHGAGPRPAPAGSVQRMVREMAEALDAVAAQRPLVLVLEDMHWCDHSSVDWLVMWARRREPARALIVATCRPVELIVRQHPLERIKQELVSRGVASEIALGLLDAADVRDYVEQRLPAALATREVVTAVYGRSQGHPLFMVHMADHLRRSSGVPSHDDASLASSVSGLIETLLARLAPEQLAVLEAASVAGAEFAAATVGAALERPTPEVEAILETLARRGQFVEPRGLSEWRDGTVSGRYGFRHALHRDALRQRLGAARAACLHGRVGERLSAAFSVQSVEVAAELAAHFEAARDARQAARHRCQAAGKSLQCYAYRESLEHADQGLALLAPRADGSDDRLELELRLARGVALLATLGYGTPAVEATYTRALALAIRLDDDGAIGPILAGLYNLYLTRAEFTRVDEVADRLQTQVEKRSEPALAMLLHNVRGAASLFAGDAAASLAHADRTLALYDPEAHQWVAATYGEDLPLASHHCAALARWITGFPTIAARHLAAGFQRARDLDQPFGEAQMLWMEALLRLDDGDAAEVDRLTLRLIGLCAEHDFALWGYGGQILRGGALAGLGRIDEGRALIERGLQSWRNAGTVLILPHWLAVAARVETAGGRIDGALNLLDEALAIAHRTGERWYEAELHRQRGETLLALPDAAGEQAPRAQACLERAVELAGRQGARLFEARARASLASWWLRAGRVEEAAATLQQARDALAHAVGSRDLRSVAELQARASRQPSVRSRRPVGAQTWARPGTAGGLN